MNELKEHLFCECDECIREYRRPLSNEMRPYYLKSEADKVIAEKDKEIAELKEQIEVLKHQACKMNCMMVKHYNEVCDDNIHQKYKRCLAMALVWFERAENSTDWKNELVSRKRFSKWMELAEEFKEAK